MPPRALFVLSLALVIVPILNCAVTPPPRLQSLIDHSPFGSTADIPAAAKLVDQPLEFRAVLEEYGSRIFSIYDSVAHRSSWVGMNDSVNGYTVKAFDEANVSVTIEYHGKTHELPIKGANRVVQLGSNPMVGVQAQPPPRTAIPQPFDRVAYLQKLKELHRNDSPRKDSSPSPGTMTGSDQP